MKGVEDALWDLFGTTLTGYQSTTPSQRLGAQNWTIPSPPKKKGRRTGPEEALKGKTEQHPETQKTRQK